jgi:beta-glucanase (GH16 family)
MSRQALKARLCQPMKGLAGVARVATLPCADCACPSTRSAVALRRLVGVAAALITVCSASIALGRADSPVAGTWLANAVPATLTRFVPAPGTYSVAVSVLAHSTAETVTVYVPGAAPRIVRARPHTAAKLSYSLSLSASAKSLTVHAISEGPRVVLAMTLARASKAGGSSAQSRGATAGSADRSSAASDPSSASTPVSASAGDSPAGSTSRSGTTSSAGSTSPSGATPPGSPAAAGGAPAQAPDPYTRLLLDDQFAGPQYAPPDSDGADLTQDTGPGTCGSQTLNTDTSSAANASLDGHGDLAITALDNGSGSEPYTSAQLESAFSAQYGSVQARIEVPAGQGLCTAFWMVGDSGTSQPCVSGNCGEIDILEAPAFVGVGYPNYPPYSIFTIHGPISGTTDTQQYESNAANATTIGDPTAGFHTYGLIWSPGSIVWTIDGVAYASANPATVLSSVAQTDPGSRPSWEFDSFREHLILDLAVGGWPGSPATGSAHEFPATMLINWVRWYGCQTGTPQNACT